MEGKWAVIICARIPPMIQCPFFFPDGSWLREKFVSHDNIMYYIQIRSHNLVRVDYHMMVAVKKMNWGLNFYEKALILWNMTF